MSEASERAGIEKVRAPHEDGSTSTDRLGDVSDLQLDFHNANRGTQRGREALNRSLCEYGAGRGVLVDRAGRVIAGNKTVEQARQLGIPIRIVETDGTHLVAVQRRDLDLETDPRARGLAIADNRVGELDLEWDTEVLQALQEEGVDLSAFWTDDEFAELVGDMAGRSDVVENDVVEPGPTDIELGDLFRLGRHRLLCGDATNEADVARVLDGQRPQLMATDPPYGVQYDPAWRHRNDPRQRTAVGAVVNDDRADWGQALALFPGAVAYVWHAGLMAGTVTASLERAGFEIRSQIIWVKQHFAFSRGHYHWRHEPAWYAVRRGQRGHWSGDRTQTTVWEVANLNPHGGDRSDENMVTGHATQKPVALWAIPIRNHTTEGDAIYDPFSGSGTAIIAAERTRRVCLALDVDPRYVQVAISRWETFTGERAERVGRAGDQRRCCNTNR